MCYRCGLVRPWDGPRELRVRGGAGVIAYRVGPGTRAEAILTDDWEDIEEFEDFPKFDNQIFFRLTGRGIISERYQRRLIKLGRFRAFRRKNRGGAVPI